MSNSISHMTAVKTACASSLRIESEGFRRDDFGEALAIKKGIDDECKQHNCGWIG